MMRFGSSRRELPSPLPVRPSRTKTAELIIVLGRATPLSGDRGSVTFSIITDDAKIIFNTSYHFGT